MHRHANMSKTKCNPDTMPFDPPEWVKQMQKRSENSVTPNTKQPHLRFRLIGKQKTSLSTADRPIFENTRTLPPSEASSSTQMPRTGVG